MISEPQCDPEERLAAGRFFTPEPVVQFIVRRTLDPLLENHDPGRPLRVLEPACGAGVFLVAAYRHLLAWREARGTVNLAERRALLLSSVFGLDIDPVLVAASQAALAATVGCDSAPPCGGELAAVALGPDELNANIRCGDALLAPDSGGAWPPVGAETQPTFDAVIGNPPYVSIRRLTKSRDPAVKDYFRRRFRCAAGAYDLYVLFVERAWELLRPGGRCGLILPNRIATAEYAQACRRLLQEETTIHCLADLSSLRAFPDARVYPYVVVWQKRRPSPEHRVSLIRAGTFDELVAGGDGSAAGILQSALCARRGWPQAAGFDVESRVPTDPLGEIAELHSGVTGFDAQRIAAILSDEPPADSGEAFAFIVSGNIDRYSIRRGNVRFMKRRFARPKLPAAAPELTDRKRRLYRQQKILIAGMTRRLEAAWDAAGLAPGVQVFTAVPRPGDAWYLLALLNSRLLSFLFQQRFGAKRVSGGYLAIHLGQLRELPIRRISADDEAAGRLRQLVERQAQALDQMARESAATGQGASLPPQWRTADQAIDQAVYHLYGLTDAEIAQVEAAVPDEAR